MLKKPLILMVLMFTIAPCVNAATVSYSSGPFGADLFISADETGDFSFGTPAAVTGLQQFNPALGTLTGVSFIVSAGDFSVNADLYGEPVTGAMFDGEFQGDIQADLIYNNGTSGLVLDLIGDSINLLCSGTEPDPCGDNSSNNFDFATDSSIIPRILSEFNLSDIVGTGDVTNLSLSVDPLGFSFVQNSGLNFISVDGLAEITNATVSVTYSYAVVPVPAAVWLFGSGLIGLIGIARKKIAV